MDSSLLPGNSRTEKYINDLKEVTMKYRSTIGVAVLVLVVISIFVVRSYSQSQPKRYMIKLYSADRVIGTWDALDYGKVDGQSLEFHVGNRSFPTRVRINGTFSVEERD